MRISAKRVRNLFGLVIIARAKHLVPSRTQPLSAVAPMVLRLKTWESRSSPNLISSSHQYLSTMTQIQNRRCKTCSGGFAFRAVALPQKFRIAKVKGTGENLKKKLNFLHECPCSQSAIRLNGGHWRGMEQPGSSSGS